MRYAIYVLLLLAGPVFSAEPVYTWRSRADDPDRVYLYRDGKQIGGWCYRAKHYRAFDGETWGPPSDAPPVSLPELTLRGHTSMIFGVAFSPDGKRIASGSLEMVKVWDLATRKEILSLKGDTDYARVAFSPDGKRIASGGGGRDDMGKPDMGKPGEVKVWDAATGQEILSLKGHTAFVGSVAFSPDGKRIVSGGGGGRLFIDEDKPGEVKVWDAATGQEILSLKGHTSFVGSVSFSPDGKRIVSGGGGGRLFIDEDKPGEVKVWDAATGRETISLKGHTDRVTNVAFSPDGKRIVSGSWDNTVKVWDAATGQETLSLNGQANVVFSVAFSPDGKRIVSGGGEVKVWDAATGRETLSPKGHTAMVYSVAFSPDGKRIVSGSGDQTVKVWDANTGKETLSLKGHTDLIFSVAFSPDGKRIVSGSWDNTVKVWDVAPPQSEQSRP